MKDKTNGVEALEALESMNRALILKCVPNVFTNKLYAIIKQALLQAVEDKKKVERYFELKAKHLDLGDMWNDKEFHALEKELTSDE